MDTKDWADVKERLKKAVDQGMKVLKEGSEDARYMASQTAQALQLEMDIFGLKNRIEKLTYKLGEKTAEAHSDGKVKVTPEILQLSTDVQTLRESLKKKESQLRSIKFTRGTSEAPAKESSKEAPKKKRARKKAKSNV